MNRLVLSLYPGLGLLDRAFEEEGFTVVRGPDLLWGGNTRRFAPPRRVFAGIIGGPPCQAHSTAREILNTSTAVDEIPDFVRCVREGEPDFAVMENVRGPMMKHEAVPREWHPQLLKDWDCGGETARIRAFWTWPFMLMAPSPRASEPSLSVLASTAKKGKSQYAADKRFLPGNLSIEEYERLQGVPGMTAGLMDAGASKYLAVHLLGNGVPLAMGRVVARAAREHMEHKDESRRQRAPAIFPATAQP